MTARTGDPGLRGRMIDVIEVRIVERAGEERHGIVTAGAEARALHRSRRDRAALARVLRTLKR